MNKNSLFVFIGVFLVFIVILSALFYILLHSFIVFNNTTQSGGLKINKLGLAYFFTNQKGLTRGLLQSGTGGVFVVPNKIVININNNSYDLFAMYNQNSKPISSVDYQFDANKIAYITLGVDRDSASLNDINRALFSAVYNLTEIIDSDAGTKESQLFERLQSSWMYPFIY